MDDEARILDPVLSAHALEVALPAFAVGRVREHEVELARWKGVVRKRRVFRAANNVVGGFAFAFQEEVGLRDRVGLSIDLLAIEVRRHLFAVVPRELLEWVFSHLWHSAR